MASADVRIVPVPHRRAFRLRYLLVGLFGALGITWSLPRARAAWRLHDTAVLFADYALCMAGPTGAVELRDQPREFWRLVRRRLVASGSGERVFANCSQLARRLTGENQVAELHNASAGDFAEWGAKAASLNLNQLARALPDLSTMSQNAWPFLRSGVAVLVKPSLGAKEAIHPVQSARPGTILGLRLYGKLLRARRVTDRGWFVVTSDGRGTLAVRSRDRGRNWIAASPWQAALEGTNDRCASDGSDHSFALETGHRGMGVVHYDHGTRSGRSSIGGPNGQVVGFGCDEIAAVALTRSDGDEFGIELCVLDEPCRSLPLPPILARVSLDGIDVARLRGATVIAVSQGPIVRVVSTRDDGRSYTPFTVAFDHDDNPAAQQVQYWPAQLLAIAGTLLLVQEAKTGNAPSVALVSNDFGASWRTPGG